MAPSMLQYILPEPVTTTPVSEIKNKVSIVTNLKFNTSIDLMDWRLDSDHARFFWQFNDDKFIESLDRGPSSEMRHDEWTAITGEVPELFKALDKERWNYFRLLQFQNTQNVVMLPEVSYNYVENIHGIQGQRLAPSWKTVVDAERNINLGGKRSLTGFNFSNYYKFRFRRLRPSRNIRLLGEYPLITKRRRPIREKKPVFASKHYFKNLAGVPRKLGPTRKDPFELRTKSWYGNLTWDFTRLGSNRRMLGSLGKPWVALPVARFRYSLPLVRHRFQRRAGAKLNLPAILRWDRSVSQLLRLNNFLARLRRSQIRSMASISKIFLFTLAHSKLFVKGNSARKLRIFIASLISAVSTRFETMTNFYKPFLTHLNRSNARTFLPRNSRKILGGSTKFGRFSRKLSAVKPFIRRIHKAPRKSSYRKRLAKRLRAMLRFRRLRPSPMKKSLHLLPRQKKARYEKRCVAAF